MHGMHARLPKNFVLEERLERYGQVIELQPARYAGAWAQACYPLMGTGVGSYERVHVDLGCGKGAFVVQAAQANPQTLYIAIDGEPICIAYTAQHVMEAGLPNVVVVPALGSQVSSIFGEGEVDRITLNFPTPFPRKKEAHKRLTILERLADYRHILAPEGVLAFKTDSLPLWRFSLEQLELSGYQLLWSSTDAQAERPNDIRTEYEERLSAQGAKVFALEATPGPEPEHIEQTASLSLIDYLPQDLEGLDYVPHGMQGTVTNLRNRQFRAQRKGR